MRTVTDEAGKKWFVASSDLKPIKAEFSLPSSDLMLEEDEGAHIALRMRGKKFRLLTLTNIEARKYAYWILENT